MRPDLRLGGTPPAFTLVCPGYGGHAPHDAGTGHLAFTIGSLVIAQIGHDDLLDSWMAADTLSADELASMTRLAAGRLMDILDDGLPSADLIDAVTDAAVVFLLAMKRSGISDPKRIPACTVMWNGQEGREHVVFGT